MITAIIVYEHPQAPLLVESLQPDNTTEMTMQAKETKMLIVLKASKLRTVIASCDDLFVNLQVAQEMLSNAQE